MLHLKDLEATTGYIRGGCSPIGMKNNFPPIWLKKLNNILQLLFLQANVACKLN